MSYTYTTFQTALAIQMAVPNNDPTNPQFVAILPTLIDQAEQRCYRDLDLLYATSAQTIALTAGSSKLDFSILSPNLLILENMHIILPAGTTNPDQGERMTAYPVSREWLRMVYGVNTVTGPPIYFAMSDDHTVALGPFPDAAYTVELVGKFRPTPLYAAPPVISGGLGVDFTLGVTPLATVTGPPGSQTTFLASVLPDLFLAAAMCAATGYQHNWGAQSDDPRSAMSWETNYQTLLASAQSEETRKKYHGWMSMTSQSPPLPSRPGTPGPP